MSAALFDSLRRFGVLLLIPVALLFAFLPPVERLDLAVFDAQSRLLRALAPRPAPRPDPVLIGIDEATYRALPEPFALWHDHIAALLEGLVAAGAGPIGFDIVLPDRSFDALLPGRDRALMAALLKARRGGPIILGITVDDSGRPRPVHPPLLAATGPKGHAFVLWRLDRDRVVRRFTPLLTPGDPDSRVLVGAMLEAMGRAPRPGLIDYTVGPAWTYLPLHEVLDHVRSGDGGWLRERFDGRPVFLGTVLPFEDRRLQPVDLAAWEPDVRNVPGVLIHAQALRAQIAGSVPRPLPGWATPLMALAALLLWRFGSRSGVGVMVLLGTTAGLLVLSTGLLYEGVVLAIAAPLLTAATTLAARSVVESLAAVAEKRRLRSLFSGYVSPDVLHDLLAGKADAGTAGRRREVCLLFSDIRGFTTRSEKLAPEAVVTLLNRYFEEMVAAIHSHGGTVDKFIGDGLMAFFGAPQALDNPAAAAFAAGREMLERLDRLNDALRAEGDQPIAIGIGLHLGPAVIGNVGPAERHEYTAIGDAVNTCSRVEGLTKSLGCPLLVTDTVAAALPDDPGLRPLGEVPIKGRAPVRVLGWTGHDRATDTSPTAPQTEGTPP